VAVTKAAVSIARGREMRRSGAMFFFGKEALPVEKKPEKWGVRVQRRG
jgi:hypothetical protein